MQDPDRPELRARPGPRALRTAAALVALGLLIEAGCLTTTTPATFLGFMLAGGALVVLGIGVYLYAATSR